MTFEMIVRASVLQDYLETLQSLVDEAALEFHDESVYTVATDPANVANTNLRIHDDACEHYHTDEMSIGVNLERFDDYLSKAKSDDLVELTFNGETRKIDIEYGDVSVSMAGIDPDAIRNGQTLPDDAIDSMYADLRMDGAALKHAIDVAGLASDHIEFDSDPDRDEPFHVIGKGDTDDARIEFSNALQEGSEIDQACMSLFSEDYLDDIVGTIPKNADVRVQHGEEWPLRITYEFPDAAVDVEFGLAPRIQSE